MKTKEMHPENARTKEQTLCSYIIEGKVELPLDFDLTSVPLSVHAYEGDNLLGSSDLDEKGNYKISFTCPESMPTAEMRITPGKTSETMKRPLAANKLLYPHRFEKISGEKEDYFHARFDLILPERIKDLIIQLKKIYKMQGEVYATRYDNGTIQNVSPIPGVKIEFYEVDTLFFLKPIKMTNGINAENIANPLEERLMTGDEMVMSDPEITPKAIPYPIPTREEMLGTTYTNPRGEYQFEFMFKVNWFSLFGDRKPDIRAKIYQFHDYEWKLIHIEKIDWNIVQDFQRDYFIPEEKVIHKPDSGVHPSTGLRYMSIGLLPIDDLRLKKGYAFSFNSDPVYIRNMKKRPFCSTLRIFGLFAKTLDCKFYKVQYAVADENGPTGTWKDIKDPLTNCKWNDALRAWIPTTLGPDPVTELYTNIDAQPHENWNEPGLKVTWNTRQVPNGYYALRMIAYKDATTVIDTYEMPYVLRIDNTIPAAQIASADAVATCGKVNLPATRKLKFRVIAYDNEGHVLRYIIRGTRGPNDTNNEAGSNLVVNRPQEDQNWNGNFNALKEFSVSTLQAQYAQCNTLPYNFELIVYGAGTNGYHKHPQYIRKDINLIVQEPLPSI